MAGVAPHLSEAHVPERRNGESVREVDSYVA
jgi:hypothetical protein